MSEPIPELTVHNPGEADEEQMVELLFRVFRRWPQFEIPVSAIEHLRWKMRSDPAAMRHHWVGEIDDSVVVMLLRIIRRVRVRGRDCLARDDVDAAVDPDYKGQGAYAAMVDESQKRPQYFEVDFGISYSSNLRLQHRNVRKGSKPLANPIQVLQKPYRARAIVRRRREKHARRLPAPLAVLRIKLETVDRYDKRVFSTSGGAYLRGQALPEPTTRRLYDRCAVPFQGRECNLSAKAFRHLAGLAGADPRQMASNLPEKAWNFIA